MFFEDTQRYDTMLGLVFSRRKLEAEFHEQRALKRAPLRNNLSTLEPREIGRSSVVSTIGPWLRDKLSEGKQSTINSDYMKRKHVYATPRKSSYQ